MKTQHQFFFSDSRNMVDLKNESVDLIVTSPPYPMIQMWDSLFGFLKGSALEVFPTSRVHKKLENSNKISIDDKISQALTAEQGAKAFELMHKELDKTWAESHRVLKEGGFACINIGDATRTVGNNFQLYSNHSRIIQQFKKLRFYTLPMILWHKKTNAPNKFMGSGMLPAGAYITLEHEYILIFRKGPKRTFKTKKGINPMDFEKSATLEIFPTSKINKKQNNSNKTDINIRQKSAFFWEERNKWFSDIWFDMPGASQNLQNKNLRKRSGAFPLELAHRLICMYSLQSDTVLDPFAGAGTTALSAITNGRNSVSFEIDKSFKPYIMDRLATSQKQINNKISQRLLDHIRYAKDYAFKKSKMKYKNRHYGFPVMTAQEQALQFPFLKSINLLDNNLISAEHSFMVKDKSLSLDKAQVFSEGQGQQAPNNYEQITIEV